MTKTSKNITPLVSVCMITYNHEDFIVDAILGVLNQKFDYPFELILSNDNSTDKTNQKIEEILKNHPKKDIVRYFNQKSNLGMMPNFIYTLEKTRGKYVATCEGDDFWIDDLKLQKQIDFLESNPDYSIIATQVNTIDLFKNSIGVKPNKWDVGEFGKNEILKDFNIHTSSFVLRKLPAIPNWYKDVWSGDFFLCWLALENGKGYYLNFSTSNYRLNPDGGQSFKDPINRFINYNKNLVGLNAIKFTEKNIVTKTLIGTHIKDCYKQLLSLSYELLNKKLIFNNLGRCIFHVKATKQISILYFKCLLAIILPNKIIRALRKNSL